uniref:Neur_chan_memb domain-containing protein n=1 Tax=Rhodnius prolixus TaxID=13249 RepID=T1HA78_RHOPR
MGKGLRMPQFEIVQIEASNCQESFQIGNYSCLVAEFYLSRSVGFHLVQSYLPTILIVVISWVSFWMDVDSVPGRTTLGVTTLLAVSSQSSGMHIIGLFVELGYRRSNSKRGIQSGLPQVSYVKAIDVWMGTCTAFVFCALLEFTIVNYMWRKVVEQPAPPPPPVPQVPDLNGDLKQDQPSLVPIASHLAKSEGLTLISQGTETTLAFQTTVEISSLRIQHLGVFYNFRRC